MLSIKYIPIINNFMSAMNKSIKKNEKVSIKGFVKKRRKTSDDFDYDAEQEAMENIMDTFEEFDEYILGLDQKIQARIDNQQNKILYAYSKHLEKVTNELKKLKEKYDFNQQKFSSNRVIAHLNRQCVLFRQQAIHLHTQLEDAIDQVDVYRRKSDLLESQIKKTNESLKKYIQRVKQLESEKTKIELKLTQGEQFMSNFLKDSNVLNSPPKTQKKQSFSNETYLNTDINSHIKQYNENSPKKQTSPNTVTKQKQKLLINRPQTTQAKIDDKSNMKNELALSIQKLDYFTNRNGIFANEKILAFHETVREKPKQMHSGRKQMRNKTNYSIGSYTYRNLMEDQTTYVGEQELLVAHRKGQLQLFHQLMEKIELLRSNLLQKKIGCAPMPISARDSVELLLNDSDVISLMKTLFRSLEIEIIENTGGIRLKAKYKESNKSLAQLSAALMQKFKMKRVKTEDASSYHSQRQGDNNEEQRMRELLSSGKTKQVEQVQKQKANNAFKRMQKVFSKKAFTKNHRIGKYPNNNLSMTGIK